jgi:hypothetical protein
MQNKIQRIEVRNCLSCFTNTLLRLNGECVCIIYNTKKQKERISKILSVYRNSFYDISNSAYIWNEFCNQGYLSKYFICSRKNIFNLKILCKYINIKVIIINNKNKKVI